MWTPIKALKRRREIKRIAQGSWHTVWYRPPNEHKTQRVLLRVGDHQTIQRRPYDLLRNELGLPYEDDALKTDKGQSEPTIVAKMPSGPKKFKRSTTPNLTYPGARYKYRFPKPPLQLIHGPVTYGINWDKDAWEQWKQDYAILKSDPKRVTRGLKNYANEWRRHRAEIYAAAIFL